MPIMLTPGSSSIAPTCCDSTDIAAREDVDEMERVAAEIQAGERAKGKKDFWVMSGGSAIRGLDV